ncbi:MAG: MutS-related protein [Chitinophagaceae bacterium]
MQVDKLTQIDLAIIHPDEEQSLLSVFNCTHTIGGKLCLKYLLQHPLANTAEIIDTQLVIKHLQQNTASWPASITNGTIMVLDKFFETPMEKMPAHPVVWQAWYYQLINRSDFALAKYSMEHMVVFLQGMQQMEQLLQNAAAQQLQNWQQQLQQKLAKPTLQAMIAVADAKKLTATEVLHFANYLKQQGKKLVQELIDIFSWLDAYHGVAKAMQRLPTCFPTLLTAEKPFLHIKQLYHPLVQQPTAYNVQFEQKDNFLFLTGANMAGKSTFIKAVGISVYLAHLGFPVPAAAMQLTFCDGLLSNIQVSDNVVKGESYFFSEVLRIKNTILKINDGKKWLILIDELFKGTNVQDAMKCSTVVMEGLLRLQNNFFIVSTHLYEIGEDLKKYNNIQFRYFETSIQNDQLQFSYQLKNGISNDRLGYLILKREGVVELLNNL